MGRLLEATFVLTQGAGAILTEKVATKSREIDGE